MTDFQEAVQILEVDLANSEYGTRGHSNAEAMLNAVMAEAERRAAQTSVERSRRGVRVSRR